MPIYQPRRDRPFFFFQFFCQQHNTNYILYQRRKLFCLYMPHFVLSLLFAYAPPKIHGIALLLFFFLLISILSASLCMCVVMSKLISKLVFFVTAFWWTRNWKDCVVALRTHTQLYAVDWFNEISTLSILWHRCRVAICFHLNGQQMHDPNLSSSWLAIYFFSIFFRIHCSFGRKIDSLDNAQRSKQGKWPHIERLCYKKEPMFNRFFFLQESVNVWFRMHAKMPVQSMDIYR